jgi:hypothetical protein
MKNKKEEIYKEKLFEGENRDKFYKNLFTIIANEDKKYENEFIKSAKYFELENLVENKRKNQTDYKNLLEKSVLLNIKEKINPIIFNIEKFDNLKNDTEKLFNMKLNTNINSINNDNDDYNNKDIDNIFEIKNDFCSILGNLFLVLYNKEKMNLNTKDFFYMDYFESNLHKNCNLLEFIIDIPIIKNKSNGVLEKFLIKINSSNEFKIKNKKNDFKEIMNIEYIDEFKEIMELDNYFTLIRNSDNYKVTLLLAEIFTENSKNFKEESLFWIKYNLTLAKIHDFPEYQCRSIILACIYLMDNITEVNKKK